MLYARFIKRGCDIVAAAAILILALPLLALVWIAVRLAFGAPVLYFSERAGKGGRPFLSMIGPRPLPLRYLSRYSPRQARRLEVLPGLTGWAQIHGRNSLDWPTRLELDAQYVDMLNRWYAPFLDLWIALSTVLQLAWQALTGRGIAAPGSATMTEL